MTAEETLGQLQLHGWCVVENVIPAVEVEAVRASVERSAAPYAINGKRSIDIPDVLNVDQSFAPYLANEAILAPLRLLWGSHIRLRTAKGFICKPGFERGGLHADGPYIQSAPLKMDAPYQDFIAKITAVWMLTAFTPENGATLVVPGSHRAPNNRTGGLEQPVPHPSEVWATGRAGSVVLFDSRTWHGSGANESKQNRIGLVMTYFPWWLGQDPAAPAGSSERERLKEETRLSDEELGAGTAFFPAAAYAALNENVKPLLRHWVRP
tara:strand:- start:118 stop:918 length:801 start_codon:yes stop_codon:yes gene_type:complete